MLPVNDIFTSWTQEERKDYSELKSVESRRLFMQYKFKRDFKAFIYLLGYRDLGAFHREEIDRIAQSRFIKDDPVRRLWLWSRGFFKTSIITQAHAAWLIVNNIDIRILLVSYTLAVVKKMLGEIKSPFVDNEEFRFFFREYCPKVNTAGKIEFGTSEYFTIPNRRKKFLKEPTIMCAGVGTNLTGLHFDYMKIDDLVTRDSVTNDTQIQASKDYYSSLRQLFDKPAVPKEDVVGTIYHFNGLNCKLQDNPEFTKSLIPVHDKDERYIFPERIDRDGFRRLCADPNLSPYDISSQYLLTPHNPADAVFREEWWQPPYEDVPAGCVEYILCDPASTQKKKSDYTVLERWGVDAEGIHHLLEGIRDKLTAFQRIDIFFRMVRNARNLQWAKYEVLGGRHGDIEVIKQRQVKEKLYFNLLETKSTNASKQDRIAQRLAGPWHAGVIRLPKNLFFKSLFDGKAYDFVQLYKLEFLQFPFCEHDDILDCHSQLFEEEVMLGKRKPKEIKETPMTMGEYVAMSTRKDIVTEPYGRLIPGR